jgi:exonuclease SbcC
MKQIAVKVTAVNSEIQRILNQLTFDELVASNIVAQKELNKVVEQRRSDRISIINTFLNLDSFNKSIGKAG